MELKAVKIIHNILTRIDFCFLAEFFRLAGIYVVECIKGDDDISPFQDTENCYDVTISTCGDESTTGNKFISFRMWTDKLLANGLGTGQKKDEQKKALKLVLDDICQAIKAEALSEKWKPIIEAYVENELLLHSMNLQYYIKKPSFPVEKAQAAFFSAYEFLDAQGQTGNKNIDYARLFCMVKVNLSCSFMDQMYGFPVENLGNECLEYVKKYPDFSNMKVLLGLCFEYEPIYAPMAIQAFEAALPSENMFCYASHIYYWLGKQCEIYERKRSESARNYRESYEKKHKFKNMYKLAIIERNKGNYEEAIEYFRRIIGKLERKLEANFADPLELEYYFKSYAMIAIIYYSDLEDYYSAVKNADGLLRQYDSIVDNNLFYNYFYGKNASQYKILTKRRFEIKRVRSILYYSYQYLGFYEEANEIVK